MENMPLFTYRQYARKCINTFLPRVFFQISPKKYWTKRHWSEQGFGDIHGYHKYSCDPLSWPFIFPEIKRYSTKEMSILDLGCNCGAYLSMLRKEGYSNLTGVDISKNAIEYGRSNYDLNGVDMVIGSFEDILPLWAEKNQQFDLVYTVGATIELVHPSFDIIHYLCRITRKTVILLINEWEHAYPRFWEYEFNRNGFLLVRCIRWRDNELAQKFDVKDLASLLVFQRV
jgi:SAM-dependent methyltransferase